VLIGTVIVLLLIVVLLALPVTLTFQLSWKQTLTADLKLKWAFGLVRADVSPGPGKSESEKTEAARHRRSRGKKIKLMGVIRQRKFRRRILRFLSDLWRAIHKQNVRLRVRLGLGDPADTGRLCAVLGPLSGVFASMRHIRVVFEPDFLDSTLEVDSSGTVRMIPLQITFLALALLFSPAIWRGIMSMRRSG
jgi:hypothetical protein